jgi:hypothetical protein
MGGGLAIAEQVLVQVPTLEVRQGKGSFEPAVASVHQNDKLDVVAKDGNWLRVRTADGKEGFVKVTALTSRGVAAGGTGVGNNALVGGSDAGLAGRGGLSQEGQAYANNKHYNTAEFLKAQRINAAVTPEATRGFQQQGHVGAAKGR